MSWKIPDYQIEQVFLTCSQVIDWGFSIFNIPYLWRKTKGQGVKIAVLDTGVYSHPDLDDAIIQSINITDNPDILNCHGTFCASIIAARDNDIGIIGVAPKSSIISIKCINDSGTAKSNNIIKGFEEALNLNPDIISMSFGSSFENFLLHDLIKTAIKKDIVCIAAVGNNGPNATIDYPAKWDEVVGVAALDKSKKIPNYCSRGSKIDFVAPGSDITGCAPPDKYVMMSGSSMATPFIAGIIALYISLNGRSNIIDLKDKLKKICVPNPDNFGIIDVEKI